MAKLILISWRDLPAQVLVKRGRDTAKVQLSQRFQEAVDRAAMRAGKSSSNDYLNDWKRSEPQACGDDIEFQAQAEAARIEAAYSDDDLLRIMRVMTPSWYQDSTRAGSTRCRRPSHTTSIRPASRPSSCTEPVTKGGGRSVALSLPGGGAHPSQA